jgi:DNA-binding CsgD family transcriptional regulator/PAS domain-containing protein
VGLDPDFMRHARASWREGTTWMTAAGKELGTRFLRVSDYYSDTDLEGSEFVQEFIVPQRLAIEWPIVHIIAPEEAVLSSGIAVLRREGGPAISEQQLGIADRLVPHLKRAITIYGQLANVEHQQIALHEVIDRIPTGVIILDTRSQPVVVNRMAAHILELGDGLSIDASGAHAHDRDTTSRLRSLIDSAINPIPGRDLAGGGFMALPRPSGLRSYPVLITPILGRSGQSTMADAAVVLFISDPEFRDVSFANVLTEVYGLTPAEAELAQLLAQGRSLEEAAAVRNVTLNTARSQLKQVFAKTHTNRQGELLQLVLSGVAVIDGETNLEAENGERSDLHATDGPQAERPRGLARPSHN